MTPASNSIRSSTRSDRTSTRSAPSFDVVSAAGPEDDISQMLEDLEDTIKEVRKGGLIGSGAKGHREAREKFFELKGRPV